ncbi:MAG: hypothetical protein KJ737_23715 [Proteobacteria bacterium]|nr:hypothetical protein [Pseudomonadota bacterium]
MKNEAGITGTIRRICILFMCISGLLSIVATSNDDDKKSSTTTTATTTTSNTNTAPTAAISAPADAAAFTEGALITFAGTGTDTEDGALSGSELYWSSSIDGRLGIGATLRDVSLSTGTHSITLTATDSEGAANAATISITINPVGNTLPAVSITTPSDGDTFSYGDYITFTGTGTDAEDGDLTESDLTWTSNKNKHIGVGTSFETDQLNSGNHIITLTGTDSANTKVSASITISIKNTLPVAKISWPADGDEFTIGEPIACHGTGYDSEDGEMGGAALVWRLNGNKVGEGNSCDIDYIALAGDYILALHVTDSAGETDVDFIGITIISN